MIRVRFAPSPTGYLHIGGARTALFNWMYAKAQGGQCILRIEDTDRERSKEEFLEEILTSMKWLGMDWDEMYRQSDRFDIYRQYATKLLEEGKAYKDGAAIILKIEKQEVKIYDLIRGEIVFDTETIKDQVLMKSDGSPTYSFACVMDDALMEISHVIRGEDHISNTPKQIMIYQALGFKVPKFAHLPLILGEDGGRLSKRTGAVAVSDYKKQGFLPQALVNYLMLLGWSPGNNQEMITLKAAVKKFSIKKINKAAAVFSLEKLKWLNSQYIKQMSVSEVVNVSIPFLREAKYIDDNYDRKRLENIVQLYKSRTPTLADFLERADYFFVDDFSVDEGAKDKHLTEDKKEAFQKLGQQIEEQARFDVKVSEQVFRALVEESGMSASELVHPVRVALTGKDVGPGLFEMMAALGKEKVVQRLRAAFLKR
ncbi:MAG: glutamate--tRNA ligase [Candidatus Omnitrophica bacterium]|nr:glutamate--tRNA ligase [Candidatus Omnitrophota bacterium]